ncbi:hypothetical protein D0U04_13825 [Bacillus clarus]|uniref:Uncharacterized protein n=1 Tax=Bacillus clarus TaxID=2338372 RepID=A0A090ZGQ2_9BACI|nr:hypothetical protein [Bacillus clarus]KFN03421.1 hypothetical protein DJ93_352 [Bacillus clarus]RFT66520.1 hypothetical protein D0U04_13825 [Bacillus clarus]
MAEYKTLPNYELIRPDFHIQFDSQGEYVTEDESEIGFLDEKAPFIKRLDLKPKPRGKSTTKKAE